MAYAKQVLADPKLRSHFEAVAAKSGKRPNEVAIAEYLKQSKTA